MSDTPLAQETFRAVLDELIPARDDSLPGAGTLELGPSVEARLGPAASLIGAGLSALDGQARALGADGFAGLPQAERAALVGEVASKHPGWIETLLFFAYGAYYHHPRVSAALGLEPRPPYPDGYDLEPGDLRGLEAVRNRGRAYREVL